MAQPIHSAPQFEFPITTNSQAIAPLLAVEDQLNVAEADWLAKADSLPKGMMQNNRKAEIRAFFNALRSEVGEMLRSCCDFAIIASKINDRIVAFDNAEQKHEANSAQFQRDAQKVQEGNLALAGTVRQMSVDLSPLPRKVPQAKSELKAHTQQCNANEPRHQIVKKVYDKIINLEKNWIEKGKSIPEKDQFVYFQRVRLQVLNLGEVIKIEGHIVPDLAFTEYRLNKLSSAMDAALEKDFHNNTLHAQAQMESWKADEKQKHEAAFQMLKDALTFGF